MAPTAKTRLSGWPVGWPIDWLKPECEAEVDALLALSAMSHPGIFAVSSVGVIFNVVVIAVILFRHRRHRRRQRFGRRLNRLISGGSEGSVFFSSSRGKCGSGVGEARYLELEARVK